MWIVVHLITKKVGSPLQSKLGLGMAFCNADFEKQDTTAPNLVLLVIKGSGSIHTT